MDALPRPDPRAPAAVALALLIVAGCAGTPTPSPTVPIPALATATALMTQSPGPSAAASPSLDNAAIIGSWHRTIDCQALRAVFAAHGLLESHGDWACEEGAPPHPHSHFFTADGQFGSRDPGGEQVDDGDYRLVAPDTLEFPSHEREFGYAPILVKFTVDGTVTFSVEVPPDCTATCADAYAWALSAFGTNPWEPGEIPS